jgi:hypothetical protein
MVGMARSTDEINRLGIQAVSLILTRMRWAVREQSTSDFGIDLQAEKLDDRGQGTGQLIAIQLKTGKSWFRRSGSDYVHYGQERHRTYWTNHSLPVFIVIHDPDEDVTLWQRIERHLIEEGENGRWSIVIPAGNTLDEQHEHFILAGIASDEGSVRRHRLALDIPLIKRFAEEEHAFLRIEEWVNKTLNFRETQIAFSDDPDADVDLELDTWMPAADRDQFMRQMFPWLTYELVEYDEDNGAGEVAVHVLEVELSDIGRAALALEDYFENGPPEREGGATSAVSRTWLESIDDIRDEE